MFRSHRLRKEEVPDIILALMLVAMDSGAPPGLCRDLVQAIDASICCHSTSKENEFELSVRFLRLSTSYSPVNKLRLLSFLSNGSGTTCRIAKYVAFCVITDKRAPTIVSYHFVKFEKIAIYSVYRTRIWSFLLWSMLLNNSNRTRGQPPHFQANLLCTRVPTTLTLAFTSLYLVLRSLT